MPEDPKPLGRTGPHGAFEALLPGPGKRTGMPLERETVTQILLSAGAVVLFIAGVVFVGTTYGTNGNLSAEGGEILVATIGAFVVLMMIVGLWMERQGF